MFSFGLKKLNPMETESSSTPSKRGGPRRGAAKTEEAAHEEAAPAPEETTQAETKPKKAAAKKAGRKKASEPEEVTKEPEAAGAEAKDAAADDATDAAESGSSRGKRDRSGKAKTPQKKQPAKVDSEDGPAPKKKAAAKAKKEAESSSDDDKDDESADEEDFKPKAKRPKKTATPKKAASAKKAGKKAADDDEAGDDSGDDGDAEESKPAPIPETNFAEPALEANQLKIVSWNVAGFAAALKKGFREYMEKEKPDIICLQETKINPTKVTDKDAPAGYERYFIASETAGQDGTGIFTRTKPLNVTYGIGVKEHDQEGRVITLEFDKFYVINCYVPNSGMKLQHLEYRMKWDEDFRAFMKGLDAKKPIIWCGDLNVAHLDIDLKNPKTNKKSPGFQPQERESFSKTLGTGFVDTYRKHHPTETDCYTFWSYKRESRSKDIGWRLDYFVISERFVDQVKTIYRRKYVMGSDHCPLVIHLETE